MTIMSSTMTEATRLTREGRLEEAMALLQGRAAPASGAPGGGAARGAGPLIDMVPPAAGGAAWTAPEPVVEPGGLRPPSGLGGGGGLAERLAGGLAGILGEGLGGGLSGGLRMPGGAARPVTVPEGARWEERVFSGPAGSRPYRLYVPAAGAEAGLVVMLHGCTQSPDDFAAGTRMNEVAEEMGFAVVYPGQTQAANAMKCWNWFNPADQRRDGGEPSLIAGIAREAMAELGVAPGRAFVAGLSAGGAKAAVMGEAYPDLFAAVGVHSGLACGAARDMGSAMAAMRQGGGVGGTAAVAVPTIVFHGDRDGTVHHVNGDEVAGRAHPGAGHPSEVERGRSPGGVEFTRTVHRDGTGRAVLEQWVLHGAGHAWSGGSPAGSYADPSGPDASREMARFFLEQAGR